MKKILIILTLLIFANCGNYSYTYASEENPVPKIEASVEFEWVNMDQIQRDQKIENIRIQLFGPEGTTSYKRKEFRNKYHDFLKDKDLKTHYRLISNGGQETKDFNMSGFFKKFKNDEILYSYALQPKNDTRHVYYYSAMGSLAYVDESSLNYPNFPYHSKQYRASGKLAGAIYFENRNLQYIYKPNGEFKGVWYKDKMYDRSGKELLTRTNW